MSNIYQTKVERKEEGPTTVEYRSLEYGTIFKRPVDQVYFYMKTDETDCVKEVWAVHLDEVNSGMLVTLKDDEPVEVLKFKLVEL